MDISLGKLLDNLDKDAYMKVNLGDPVTVEQFKKSKDYTMFKHRKLRRPVTIVIDLDKSTYLERKCFYFVV